MVVDGQTMGGVVNGLGWALTERFVYDDTGQLVTGTFMDYALPRASDGPSFVFETHNVPCTTNPLGVKGAGEAGAVGSPPALMNALVDALSTVGVQHIDMPATPEAVWKAIAGAKAA
jgi:carbon-monoxide dehydrogenase large subunit